MEICLWSIRINKVKDNNLFICVSFLHAHSTNIIKLICCFSKNKNVSLFILISFYILYLYFFFVLLPLIITEHTRLYSYLIGHGGQSQRGPIAKKVHKCAHEYRHILGTVTSGPSALRALRSTGPMTSFF